MEINRFFDGEFAERVTNNTISDGEKEEIKAIYLKVKRVELEITCKNCFADAYFLLYNLYRSNKKHFIALLNSEYRLKNGAVLQEFGNIDTVMTSLNSTNELSEYYLKKDASLIRHFSIFPADWEARIASVAAVAPVKIETETKTIPVSVPAEKSRRGRPQKK